MSACVVNQPRGHWLLLNVLTTIVNISLNMESKVVGLGDGFEILDEFNLELLTLQKKMWQEIIKEIKPFLLFLKIFDPHNVHNMLAIMDPRFKSLRIVKNLCGLWCNNSFCF
jgi:hypothetical protein